MFGSIKKRDLKEVEILEKMTCLEVVSTQIDMESMVIDVENRVEEEVFKQYEALCNEIGFYPAAVEEEKFKKYLLDNNIKVYDYEKVCTFLNEEYGDEIMLPHNKKCGWVWLRLLEKDSNEQGVSVQITNSSGRIFDKYSYQKAVPYHVLEIVRDIRKALPEFIPYVSERWKEEHQPADPFLMYCFDFQRYVIKHWDEPNFKI